MKGQRNRRPEKREKAPRKEKKRLKESGVTNGRGTSVLYLGPKHPETASRRPETRVLAPFSALFVFITFFITISIFIKIERRPGLPR
jgi:hypothetical protein